MKSFFSVLWQWPFFLWIFHLIYDFPDAVIPREARAEGPSVARLINLSGRAGPSGAKPREFERKIYLYIYICFFEGVRTWMTSDCLASSEKNLHTSEKICVHDQISTAMFINIHWIQNYLSTIFSLSFRNLFLWKIALKKLHVLWPR